MIVSLSVVLVVTRVATRGVREYRKHAEECRQLATLLHDPDKKDILKHLAQTWERLAEFRERLKPELELPSSLLH